MDEPSTGPRREPAGDHRRWYCERCGADGILPREIDIDQFLCPMCGELVVPG